MIFFALCRNVLAKNDAQESVSSVSKFSWSQARPGLTSEYVVGGTVGNLSFRGVLAFVLLIGSCAPELYNTDALAKDSQRLQGKSSVDGEKSGSIVTRGQPLSEKARQEIVSVGELSKRAKELDGKKIALSGVVKTVCQQKGCWFTLTQPDKPDSPAVRIASKGYLFFVPKNLSGFHAVVEGTFHIKTLSAEEVAHFAADEKKSRGYSGAAEVLSVQNLPSARRQPPSSGREEYQFSAEGVELRPQS